MSEGQLTTTTGRAALSLPRLIFLCLATKFVIDTGFQIFSPYLPTIAAGLGVDVITMGRLVSLMSAMGLVAPILGVVADRQGYQQFIRLALLLGALGTFLFGSSFTFGLTAVSMVLMGIGFAIFAPMLHAYLSAQIPYHRRARSIGIVEYSWALSSIAGLSLMGLLIAATNWRVPFFVLAGGLLLAWFIFGALPTGQDMPRSKLTLDFRGWRRWPARLRAYFDLGPSARSAWGTMLVAGLNFFASMHVIIVHGVWLSNEYGLGPAQLGVVALAAGVADLGGSVLVSLGSDRLGKRRSVLLGTLASLLAYSLLPWLNVGLTAAVISLMLIRFSFEFSIVSNIPLMSEQVPSQRGKIFTLSALFYLSSATLVGFTGPWAYTRYGLWGLGPVSAAAAALSLLVIWRWVREAK